MAVTDLFIEGTVPSGSSVTLQPAAGVCWSFKRGVLSTAGGQDFRVQAGGRDFQLLMYNNAATAFVNNFFWSLTFSEGGVTANTSTNQAGVGSGTAHPFGAITNTRTVQIFGGSFTAANYAMVGVALT